MYKVTLTAKEQHAIALALAMAKHKYNEVALYVRAQPDRSATMPCIVSLANQFEENAVRVGHLARLIDGAESIGLDMPGEPKP